jgi:hypothetical protein
MIILALRVSTLMAVIAVAVAADLAPAEQVVTEPRRLGALVARAAIASVGLVVDMGALVTVVQESEGRAVMVPTTMLTLEHRVLSEALDRLL